MTDGNRCGDGSGSYRTLGCWERPTQLWQIVGLTPVSASAASSKTRERDCHSCSHSDSLRRMAKGNGGLTSKPVGVVARSVLGYATCRCRERDPAAASGGIPGACTCETSVADPEWNRDDVRGDAIGLQVDGVDVAIVVCIRDDRRRVVVDAVLVLVGGNGDA
jgi:hypothetical protein